MIYRHLILAMLAIYDGDIRNNNRLYTSCILTVGYTEGFIII